MLLRAFSSTFWGVFSFCVFRFNLKFVIATDVTAAKDLDSGIIRLFRFFTLNFLDYKVFNTRSYLLS